MAMIGVSIVKSTSFRGVSQEFSNTYYYSFTGTANETVASELIDLVVALEKPMHSPQINFVRGWAWSAGGSPSTNNMLSQKNLTGAGTGPTSGGTDKERAFLVRFRAGNDSRGRPVYLRKYWHLDVGLIASTSISSGQIAQTAQLATAQRNQLVAWADSLKDLVPTSLGGGHATLVSNKGRPIDGATVAHPYYEHHQLGDMWR